MMDTHAMDREQLKLTIKSKLLIERLELEDVSVADIDDDLPLFGEGGLELDSIEAFEVMVGLEEEYGVLVENIPAEELKPHLQSVNSIADFIRSRT